MTAIMSAGGERGSFSCGLTSACGDGGGGSERIGRSGHGGRGINNYRHGGRSDSRAINCCRNTRSVLLCKAYEILRDVDCEARSVYVVRNSNCQPDWPAITIPSGGKWQTIAVFVKVGIRSQIVQSFSNH